MTDFIVGTNEPCSSEYVHVHIATNNYYFNTNVEKFALNASLEFMYINVY